VIELASDRVVAAGGVLDQDGEWQAAVLFGVLERLAPVLEAGRQVGARTDVAAVHDQALRTELGGRLGVRHHQLAARDADPVVQRRDVHDVRRMDVDVHVGRPERVGVLARFRRFVALRIGQEELNRVRLAVDGRGERCGGVDVSSDAHGTSLRRGYDQNRPRRCLLPRRPAPLPRRVTGPGAVSLTVR
jgi:hypothetical protein